MKFFKPFLLITLFLSSLASARQFPGIFPRSAPPEALYVIERKDLSNHDWHLASIIQGMANRSQPQIFIVESTENMFGLNVWPDYYQKEYGIKNLGTISLAEALKKYAGLFQGYALFSFEEDWTVNVADTYCAINDCLPVTAEQENLAQEFGLEKLEDFRGRWRENISAMEWAFQELYPKCSCQTAASLMPTRHSLRDYLFAHRIFIFYLAPSRGQYFALQSLLRKLPGNIPMLGYLANSIREELVGEIMLGRANKFLIPTDTTANLSVHSGIPIQPLPEIEQWSKAPDISGKLAVAFAFTDGDNIFLESEYYQSTEYWQNPDRGKLKVGWSFAPELYELAPGMIRYYYQTRTENDFLIPFSGAGYTYSTFYSDKDFFISLSKTYFQLTGLDLLWVIDPQFYLTGDQRTYKKFAEPFAKADFIKGILIGYMPSGLGKYWDDLPGYPPVIYSKVSYFTGDPKTLANAIKSEAISVPARGKILFYGVGNWKVSYGDLIKVAELLQARDDIIFISPQDAFAIIEKWRK